MAASVGGGGGGCTQPVGFVLKKDRHLASTHPPGTPAAVSSCQRCPTRASSCAGAFEDTCFLPSSHTGRATHCPYSASKSPSPLFQSLFTNCFKTDRHIRGLKTLPPFLPRQQNLLSLPCKQLRATEVCQGPGCPAEWLLVLSCIVAVEIKALQPETEKYICFSRNEALETSFSSSFRRLNLYFPPSLTVY